MWTVVAVVFAVITAIVLLVTGIYSYNEDGTCLSAIGYFVIATGLLLAAIALSCLSVKEKQILADTLAENKAATESQYNELENLQTEGYTFLVDGNEISSFDDLDDVLNKYDYVISGTDKKIILKEK